MRDDTSRARTKGAQFSHQITLLKNTDLHWRFIILAPTHLALAESWHPIMFSLQDETASSFRGQP
ncbi:MAG: hypothetical protein CV082_05405 [Candidatus Brocadia sp. BL1]|nr:MAG: hypothetical protein CV082_05405 [Candidatus Brocadia sp. BL1]